MLWRLVTHEGPQSRVWRVFCVFAGQGGAVVGCFHYIGGLGVRGLGLGDVGFVLGAGVGSDGGEGLGL